jgi:uncharacterized protein (DUF885 family)
MNTLKFVVTLFVCTFLVQVSWSQKLNQSKKTTSVSSLIATGASEEEILSAWEDLVLQKQIKSYTQAEELLEQTFQVAYLQGNRYLGASITKTAYYSTLTVELGKEIGVAKMALQRGNISNITEKNFKLKPDAKDLQRLAGIGKIDLETQRKIRFNLVEQSQSVLATTPGFKTLKGEGTITGKNQRQANLPSIFSANDVILSDGQKVENQEDLKIYLERLEGAYSTVDTNLKTSASHLQNVTMTQQQIAQGEASLSNKLLRKASSMID